MSVDTAAIVSPLICLNAQHWQIVFFMKRQNPVIEQVGRGDRGLGGVQVDLRDLAISIYMGLLINAPNTLESADIEGVLRSQIAGMGRLDLAAGCIIQLFLFQGLDLCLGQDTTFFGDFGLQRLQAGFDVRQILAQPDQSRAVGWDKYTQFVQLVGGASLTIGRRIGGRLDHRIPCRLVHPVREVGLAPRAFKHSFNAAIIHR